MSGAMSRTASRSLKPTHDEAKEIDPMVGGGATWTMEDSRYARALEGKTLDEAARELGVAREDLRTWFQRWRSRGVRP